MSLTSAAWYHDYSTDNTSNGDMRPSKNYDNTPVSELPCAKVCFAGYSEFAESWPSLPKPFIITACGRPSVAR